MGKKVCLLATVLGSIWALSSSVSIAFAAPQPTYPMRAWFTPEPGDRISSGYIYENGKDRVSCDINPNTGDFRLNLNQSTAPAMFASPLIALDPPPCDVSAPSSPLPQGLSDLSFLNVNAVLNLPVDEVWRPTGAFFESRSAGSLRFRAGSDTNCSQQVEVRHPSPGTWEVRAVTPAHARAALRQSQRGSFAVVGYFELPFHLTLQRL